MPRMYVSLIRTLAQIYSPVIPQDLLLRNTALKCCYHSGAIRSAVTQSYWRNRKHNKNSLLLNGASNGFPQNGLEGPFKAQVCNFLMLRYLIIPAYTRFFAILIACGLDMTHLSFKIPFVCCTIIYMNKLNFPITKTLNTDYKNEDYGFQTYDPSSMLLRY